MLIIRSLNFMQRSWLCNGGDIVLKFPIALFEYSSMHCSWWNGLLAFYVNWKLNQVERIFSRTSWFKIESRWRTYENSHYVMISNENNLKFIEHLCIYAMWNYVYSFPELLNPKVCQTNPPIALKSTWQFSYFKLLNVAYLKQYHSF